MQWSSSTPPQTARAAQLLTCSNNVAKTPNIPCPAKQLSTVLGILSNMRWRHVTIRISGSSRRERAGTCTDLSYPRAGASASSQAPLLDFSRHGYGESALID